MAFFFVFLLFFFLILFTFLNEFLVFFFFLGMYKLCLDDCVIIQPLHHNQDMTQGQILSQIKLVWIQCFLLNQLPKQD